MQRIVLIFLATLALGTAQANDVFVTRDAQGRPVYTDRPESLPAEKINVATKQSSVAGAPNPAPATKPAAADATKQAAEARAAAASTAEDKAKRCQEARANYQGVMNARRLYEPGSNPDERRYLSSEEIDAARADAKQVMDEFCSGQ